MISKEDVIWCWKMNSRNTLFIFREEGQEIEVKFNNSYDLSIFNSESHLLDIEKQFLINLKEELDGK